MAKPRIPIYTLKDLIDHKGINVVDPNILVFDVDSDNVDKIKLNQPSRTICKGIIVITAGRATVQIDFQEMELREMDVITLFPNNVLEFKEFTSDCSMKGVLVSVDYLSELNVQISSQQAMDYLSNNYSKIISLNEEVFQVLASYITRLQQLNNPENENFFYLEMLKIQLTLVMYEIANFSKSNDSRHHFVSFRKENIAIEFIKLVAQNFRKHKNVQYYADKLHISRKHLTRTIKEVFHKVPKQIIEEKIAVEAKLLLLKNEISISEVMAELNFDDQAVFSKFFRKSTGFSPTSYRRQITN